MVGTTANAATRSHASHEAPAGLRPSGFDRAYGGILDQLIAIEEALLRRIDIMWDWDGHSVQSDRVRALHDLRDESLGKEA